LDQLPIRVQVRAELSQDTHNARCSLLKMSACRLEDNQVSGLHHRNEQQLYMTFPSGSQAANA
jgi:hypothetical protein